MVERGLCGLQSKVDVYVLDGIEKDHSVDRLRFFKRDRVATKRKTPKIKPMKGVELRGEEESAI